MTIALSPHYLTAQERLDEIAEILANGALRHMIRKSANCRETPVQFIPCHSKYGALADHQDCCP